MQDTILKINLTNIIHNALVFKRQTNRFLYAVVKADAYGHGALAVTNALYPVADGFAVALLSEALNIKLAASGKEILVLTPPLAEDDVVTAAYNGFTLTAADLKSANLIVQTVEKYGLTVNVQVKVNTGMNRYGVYGSMLGKVCSLLKRTGQVRVCGVYSHLYSRRKELCEKQRFRFVRAVKICRTYFPLVRAHFASTFGATLGEEYLFDGVRIGLGLYGYFPEGEPPIGLLPAMSAYAVCVASRKCLFGGLGYGDERSDCFQETFSVLRGGYADGFGLSAERSGLNPVLIGNFCMDACLAKHAKKAGQWVCLFTDARTLAKERNTSVYEVLCLLGLRAKRIYENYETGNRPRSYYGKNKRGF